MKILYFCVFLSVNGFLGGMPDLGSMDFGSMSVAELAGMANMVGIYVPTTEEELMAMSSDELCELKSQLGGFALGDAEIEGAITEIANNDQQTIDEALAKISDCGGNKTENPNTNKKDKVKKGKKDKKGKKGKKGQKG